MIYKSTLLTVLLFQAAAPLAFADNQLNTTNVKLHEFESTAQLCIQLETIDQRADYYLQQLNTSKNVPSRLSHKLISDLYIQLKSMEDVQEKDQYIRLISTYSKQI